MKPRITPILLMLAIAFVSYIIIPQLPVPLCGNSTHPVFQKFESTTDEKIIFLSDTQEPIWIETLWLQTNHNEKARDLIFNEILKQKPAMVVHLGDIVAFGYKETSWDPIDYYLTELQKKNIQFYPVLGNHEELIFSTAGEKKFQQRFPFYSKTGYAVKAGRIKIILLNSNFSNMTNKEIKKQQRWYNSELITSDKDSSISTIIVGTHYSPFTNSTIVSPSKEVQNLFLPLFIKSKKAKLFISGHAHAFEHFKYDGKDFLVIGGGGGLQQPLLTGSKERWKDLYSTTKPKRMFHFLQCNLRKDTLQLTLNMMEKNFSGFNTDYHLSIPLK